MKSLISTDAIEQRIYLIRGHRVMLDEDIARIYGVSTKRLNQQVRRNSERFPEDFMFQLTKQETISQRLQIATFETKSSKYRKYLPYAFTEHGAVMVASVLHTTVAVEASIEIARAFVRLRKIISGNKALAKKIEELERKIANQSTAIGKHADEIRAIFDVIRQIMNPPEEPHKKIGFT